MFWQGGGKKRLRNQIEKIMQIPQPQIEPNTIGKNDDQLLPIYYFRDAGITHRETYHHQISNRGDGNAAFCSNIKEKQHTSIASNSFFSGNKSRTFYNQQ